MTALMRQERTTDAVAIARQIAAQPGAGVAERRLLANVLLQSDDYAGAADVLARTIALPGGTQDALLMLQYGAALEQAGRWDAARPALEKALALAPENPVVLNHLGYALADRGQELPRAIMLLEKANKIRPDEPALVDSLGWAYFRAGQADRALPLLEKAVIAEPGNPELNEHLGDVLMVLGRVFEARQAWAAARAVVGDDAVSRARIEAKLQPGVTPVIKAPPLAPTL
nr:tetratricopeptide repeat protein [Sphingobium subterraneum]